MIELTGSATDIVEGELSDARVQLHEQGKRLADTTGSTEDGDLGELHRGVSNHIVSRL